jgi:DNA-binding transcriptional ArsR family regulator
MTFAILRLAARRLKGYCIAVDRYTAAPWISLTPVTAGGQLTGRLPALLKVLADPTRLRIIGLLTRREMCVCDVETALGISQGMTSHHLGVLRRAGLLLQRREQRDARWVYYRLDPDAVHELRAGLDGLLDLSHFDGTPARC